MIEDGENDLDNIFTGGGGFEGVPLGLPFLLGGREGGFVGGGEGVAGGRDVPRSASGRGARRLQAGESGVIADWRRRRRGRKEDHLG